jgi:hypothetical protein
VNTQNPYISLEQAKAQLSIDDGLTIHDQRICDMVGAAIDWAENFTQRSLGELMELDSPSDASATPQADPKDRPSRHHIWYDDDWIDTSLWVPDDWRRHWAENPNPAAIDQSRPLRRDVHAAILLYMETLFDRNTDNLAILETRAENMLWPYRIALGV